jgi:hypothetical protein
MAADGCVKPRPNVLFSYLMLFFFFRLAFVGEAVVEDSAFGWNPAGLSYSCR